GFRPAASTFVWRSFPFSLGPRSRGSRSPGQLTVTAERLPKHTMKRHYCERIKDKTLGSPPAAAGGLRSAQPRRRVGAADVALGQLQVVRADGPGPLQFLGRDGPDHLAGDPHDHGARRDAAALGDDGPGGDEALLADLAPRQQAGADADQAV